MSPVYRQPGVSIVFIENPGVALLPSGLRIPCIVATGLTTKPALNVAVTRASSGNDTIPGTVSGDVTSITAIGDFPDLAQYISGTDFRHIAGNQIEWLSGGQAPTAAATYYVTFRKPKASSEYNKGVLYTTLQDVRNDFGDELISGVVTPITAAARLCFDNGAPAIMVIQSQTASQSDLQTALDAAKLEDVDILVAPQFCNTTLDNYVKAHLLTESSPAVRHERVWFRSADGMSDAVTSIRNQAIAMNHERVTVLAPPAFVATFKDSVTTKDQDQLLPSAYIAAAYAGIVANPNNDPATPLTRKSLVGVKNLSTFNYSVTQMNQLAGDGVTVLENVLGDIRVRHALTTDVTNVDRITQSVVFIKDNIRKELRKLLDRTFIGVKIDSSLPSRVNNTIDAFLSKKVRDTIIKAYRNINVVQDKGDPRTLTITFDVSVIYPAEFLDISISLFVA